jgi:16S rRNA (guanine527-N7)-methyltransferase
LSYDGASFAQDMEKRGIVVSPGALERLGIYLQLLGEWQAKMNLVGPSTLPDAWRRHILDSAQLLTIVGPGPNRVWMDVGTGAGFPGMVLAILEEGHVHLIDSVGKKCRFLEAVADATGMACRVTVHNARVEDLARDLSPISPQFITSRACAPLARLIPWGYAFHVKLTRWLVLKGQDVEAELDEATKSWKFSAKLHTSLSDPRGRIVEISDLQPRHGKQKK